MEQLLLMLGRLLWRAFSPPAAGPVERPSPAMRRQLAARGHAVVSPRDAAKNPYPYVYVNDDGSARELSADERRHLETRYLGSDGARPYVKWRYGSRTPTGSLAGFCRRRWVPKHEFSTPPNSPEPVN